MGYNFIKCKLRGMDLREVPYQKIRIKNKVSRVDKKVLKNQLKNKIRSIDNNSIEKLLYVDTKVGTRLDRDRFKLFFHKA
jgi:hypothetical protein